MKLGERSLADGEPCFVIAEAGVNHNGDEKLALQLVDAAADVGADAVKFQVFSATAVASSAADLAEYQRRQVGAVSQLEMLLSLELPPDSFRRVSEHARSRGIAFCATPADFLSVDHLEALDVPFFKVSSADVTYPQLLRHIAKKGRPIVLSTGMATMSEVAGAIAIFEECGNPDVALLHCVTSYPAPIEEVNLRAMASMRHQFDRPVGYSDHTLGNEISLAAVAMGARIVEKHLTLDCEMDGPDHAASLDRSGFADLVRGIREVESALGDGDKQPVPSEVANRVAVRRSVVALVDLPAGSTVTADVVACKRPGDGIPPARMPDVLGRTVRSGFQADEQISWEGLD